PIPGAEILLRALELEGVDTVFGMPGGAILQAYDTLLDSPIRHILVRHEQGGGHMASGYAHATGRVGVAFATSGPGATNLVTPLADAYMDSIPVVAITAQVPSTSIGLDAFQEAHTWGISMPCTKHNFLVTETAEIAGAVHEAFHLASTGRPGPVLVDITKDALAGTAAFSGSKTIDLPGYKPSVKGHPKQVAAAVDMILAAERPVLYTGGGVIRAGASAELTAFAERMRLPTVTTLMARGAIPDSHELALGMPGMHGCYTASTAMQRSDLLVNIGARFDDRVTGNPATFAPDAKVIHVDVDPAEIGKIRDADVPIVGDAKAVLVQLLARTDKVLGDEAPPARQEWFATLRGWQQQFPLTYDQDPDGPIQQQYVIDELHRITGGDAIVVAGVGQHQMWASQFWGFERPNTWINSGGLGTMGYAVPAAVGAQAGMPDTTVIAIDGDGCFQMTFQELITAAIEEIPVKVVVMNNASLGMVRQWQDLFYGHRHSASELSFTNPDIVMLAEAMGCVGLRAVHPDDVTATLEKGLAITDRPVVMEFRCDPEAMVFPMIKAGGSNDVIYMRPEDLG
ncbi:MAG: biosynthetic-type acetolactate synthase large subunit, partial [Acidimicrobiia bacterium]|nr:biosynthetic-type acetolactate synthase large subunit [Acidimicrobiia bacterium]